MSELIIYSASAGSGKTYNIALQYISVLITNFKDNPQCYRNILAVSFTNKASEEMKGRIIDFLHKIATNTDLALIDSIHQITNVEKSDIVKRANKIFSSILHDYSFLSVSTIDSFFQSILRSFTREIGINYNYEIEMDISRVIEITIDNIIKKAEIDIEIKQALISIVKQKMENHEKWDFRKSLREIAEKLIKSDFSEYEKEYNAFFSEKHNLENFTKTINSQIYAFISKIRSYTKELKDKLESQSSIISHSDFKGGETRSILKRLLKIEEKLNKNDFDHISIFKNIEIHDEWIGKTSDFRKNGNWQEIINDFISISIRMSEYFKDNIRIYVTCLVIRRHINYLQLINEIILETNKQLEDDGKFLINNVPKFLSEIASQNSPSFIFEKTGTYYNNFLIDEFQDTSQTQWNTFRPLIEESLSSDFNKNIVVGDIKQSIYSWRGGDWRLLLYKMEEDLQNFENFISKKTLDTNYRSGKDIVDFNNFFFDKAIDILSQNLNSEKINTSSNNQLNIKDSIYKDISQNSSKDIKSIINISSFTKNKGEIEHIVKLRIIEKLIHNIEYLQAMGYQAKDIMILVRKRSEGVLIANEILKHSKTDKAKQNVKYDIVSAESLLISSNTAIKFIISTLRYFADENNILALNEGAFIFYNNYNSNKEIIEERKYSREIVESKFKDFLNSNFVDLHEGLLYDVVENIILKFKLNTIAENIPFLNSFRNIIHDFSSKNPSEILGFLNYWDETGHKKNLNMPEEQNAISILSIHKSKGLSSEFVFIPFCDWGFYKTNELIWAELDNKDNEELESLRKLPIWLINLNKQLQYSYFNDAYNQQIFKQTIESFNLLYVAFTRAKKGLYISFLKENTNSSNKVASIINNILTTHLEKHRTDTTDETTENDDKSGISEYIIGELNINRDSKKEEISSENYINKYPIYIPNKKLKIRQLIENEKVDENIKSRISEGLVFHKIFENIKYYSDVDKSIESELKNGSINNTQSSEYKELIKKYISSKQTKQWFDKSYDIINERELISPKGKILRPDRVIKSKDDKNIIIVDYKFGHNIEKKYEYQVLEYANSLKSFYSKSKIIAYIWYVFDDLIIELDCYGNKSKKISIEYELPLF